MAGISKAAYPCAAPGTGGEIRRLDADEMRILLRPGKKRPVGRFLAKMENGEWIGADTHFGAVVKVRKGTFSEVIEWFIPPNGVVRNASREKDWRAGASPDIPVRIEGAEVQAWKEAAPQVMGLDGTPVAGRDAEMLTASRKRGGAAYSELARQDTEILRMVGAGLTQKAIGHELGLSESAIHERIKRMRKNGIEIPAGHTQRRKALVEAKDPVYIRLTREGYTAAQIAEQTGDSHHYVTNRLYTLRQRGLIEAGKPGAKRAVEGRDDAVRELFEDGLSRDEIAERLGYSPKTVGRILHEMKEAGEL